MSDLISQRQMWNYSPPPVVYFVLKTSNVVAPWIAACGSISGYNTPAEKRYGVKNLFLITVKLLQIEGFLFSQPEFGPAYFKEHLQTVSGWIADGSFKPKMHITVGIFKGENFSKAAIKIAQ